jgi:hypothetical protein
MIVPGRYNGPAGSGNGGYTCGLVAQLLGDGPAEVTLRVPPPLDTEMSVERGAATVKVYADTTLVAEALPVARPAGSPDSVVPPVSLAEATEAARSYAGHAFHPFPTCYVCGPGRPDDDGLRIFPGRLPDGRTAAPFTVPADASPATLWAALDCPGGWAVITPGRPYVLGRMSATVLAPPRPGDVCVVVGRCDGAQGRKARVSTSLYKTDGALLATAIATWIAVDLEGVTADTAG